MARYLQRGRSWIAAFGQRQLCCDFYMIEAKPENSIGDRAYDRSVAEMSPRWSCYGVRAGTAGSGEEVRSTSGRAISTKVSALATTASRQAQQQHLFERINHLAALPLIWKICKKIPEKPALFCTSRIPPSRFLRKIESADHDRFRTNSPDYPGPFDLPVDHEGASS